MTHESKNAKRAKAKAKLTAPTEGLIFVAFHFAGKRYTQTHTLSDYELRQLKDHLKNVGEAASSSVVSKTAIQNTAILAENVLARAFLDYIQKFHRVEAPTMEEAVEVLKKEAKENDDAHG